MKNKNYHIQDSKLFLKLEYTRTSKDIFDLLISFTGSLLILVFISFIIIKGLLVEFAWIYILVCVLFGFVGFMILSYFVNRLSNSSKHVLLIDKTSKTVNIRQPLFSKKNIKCDDLMLVEFEVHESLVGLSGHQKYIQWAEINLIMKDRTKLNLLIINPTNIIDWRYTDLEKELKSSSKDLSKKIANGLGIEI